MFFILFRNQNIYTIGGKLAFFLKAIILSSFLFWEYTR